jgi:hypothetical protein
MLIVLLSVCAPHALLTPFSARQPACALGAGICRPRAAVALSGAPPQPAFDVEAAVLLSGFAFEAYNEPSESDARWERGADGCHVAFMSDDFAAECYRGRLEVKLQLV